MLAITIHLLSVFVSWAAVVVVMLSKQLTNLAAAGPLLL